MSTIVVCRADNAVSAVKLGYPTYQAIPAGYRGNVINWGKSQLSYDGSVTICNLPGSLMGTIDKRAFLKTLHANGISAPELLEAGNRAPSGWVVRPNEHAEGNEFQLTISQFEIMGGYHATKFITPANEYRVWFFGRQNFLTAKRVPIPSLGQTESDPCKSKFGYSFGRPNYEKCVELIKRALEVAKLDFGAFDMLWATDERKWYILEVNTAPSLDHSEVKNFFKTHFKTWEAAQPAVLEARPVEPQRLPIPQVERVSSSPEKNIIKVRKEGGKWIELDLTHLV